MTGAPNASPIEAHPAVRARVLVVDDDADMREYATRLLAIRYDVEAVDDGLVALDAARVRRPDLVLADVVMPRLDGFGLLAAIRADPALRTIPVIMLSARADEEARVEGLDAGADDYLVKPLSPRELLARVEGTLRLDRVRREGANALRASEARQAFLLMLSDALHPLADPIAIQETAARLFGQRLGVTRAFYFSVKRESSGYVHVVERDYFAAPGMPPFVERYPQAAFGVAPLEGLARGETIALGDIETTSALSPEERAQYRAVGLRSLLAAPLIKNGQYVGGFSVLDAVARDWSADDKLLVREIAERTRDAVERARAEIALHEAQRRLEEALATARMAYWEWDSATNATIASPSMHDLFGLTPGEHFESSRQGISIVHSDDRVRYRALVEEAAARGRGWHSEFRIVRPRDGAICWLEERATVTRDPATGATRTTAMIWDITDRKRADAAAERERAARDRDALRAQLAHAEEAERRRLARELHDRLGQHLTGFALGLAEVRRRVTLNESTEDRLCRLEELARLMTRDARSIALELRPPELDDVGLESALETYVRDWGHRHGIATDVAIFATVEDRVPPDMGSALYRIAQEALTNVARHAGATQVSVILEQPDGEVRLLVEDDGRGFDLEETAARVRSERRLGLAGMRERAALAGGALAIESSPGVGTTLQVRIPINAHAARAFGHDSASTEQVS